MRQPSTETNLALCFASLLKNMAVMPVAAIARDAARVVSLAKAHRRLGERSCNCALTASQQKRYDSLQFRADAILMTYGMEMRNPWGLCRHAVPLGHDGASEIGCIFLA